jgi:beta-glucanase (GH16 family)
MLLALTVFATLATAQDGRWELVLDQTFNGPAGSAVDSSVWTYDVGGGGWGNNELQSYTAGNKNAFLDGNGHLVIEARKEPTTGPDGIAREYSSARLKTKGLKEFQYGRFEARLKMPRGQGVWPAFWTLGADIDQVSWPRCGEIDIMEFLGHDERTVYGTVHGPGFSAGEALTGKFQLPEGRSFSDGFHVFAVEWTAEEIVWLVDGKPYHKVTPKDLGSNPWPFDKPHFLLLNLAVGGNWPGVPNASTQFPQRYVVDYVRVYRERDQR